MMPCGFENTLVSMASSSQSMYSKKEALYWKPLVAVLLKTSNLGIAVSPVFIHSRLVAFVHNIPSHVSSKKTQTTI